MNRLRKGEARVEFLAIEKDIHALIDKGYTIKSIYTSLKNENKISMAYRSLLDFINGKRRLYACVTPNKINYDSKKNTNESENRNMPENTKPSGPIIVDVNPSKFGDIVEMDEIFRTKE